MHCEKNMIICFFLKLKKHEFMFHSMNEKNRDFSFIQ